MNGFGWQSHVCNNAIMKLRLVQSKFTLDHCFKGQLDCKSVLWGMKETGGNMMVYQGRNEEMGALIVLE